MDLLKKIESKQARIGIIGLGYVGLPLAIELAHAGFRVVGFDVDQSKVDALNGGTSYIPDVPSEHVADAVSRGLFRATVDERELADVDVIDICVPTPLRKTRDPDLSYVGSGGGNHGAGAPKRATRDPRVHDLPGNNG